MSWWTYSENNDQLWDFSEYGILWYMVWICMDYYDKHICNIIITSWYVAWIFDPLDVLDRLRGILLSIATSQVRSNILPIFRCFRQTSNQRWASTKTANILSSEPGKLLLSQLFEAPQWTSDRSRWRIPPRLSVAIQTSNYHILQQKTDIPEWPFSSARSLEPSWP